MVIQTYMEKLSAADWVQHVSLGSAGELLLGCNTRRGNRVFRDGEPVSEREAQQCCPVMTGAFFGFLEETGQGFRHVCKDSETGQISYPPLTLLTTPVRPTVLGEEHLIGLRVNQEGQKEVVAVHFSTESDVRVLLQLPDAQQADDLHLSIAPRRQSLVVSRRTTGPYTELVLINLESSQERVLLSGTGNWTPVSARWNEQETQLICLIRRGRQLESLLLDPETMESKTVAHPPAAEAPIWHPDGRSLLLTLDEWPYTRFALCDTETGAVSRLNLLPDHLMTDPVWHQGSLYFKALCSSEPPALYRWRPEQETPERLTPAQGFPHMPPPELLEVETDRGYSIPCLMYLPRRETGKVVFLLHGGPAGAWTAAWSPVIQLLVESDARVILVNPRGSTVRNRHLPVLQPGDFGRADVQDVTDCVRYARDKGFAEKGRVGLYGHSYGGYLAVQTARCAGNEIGAILLTSSYLDVSMLTCSGVSAVRRFAQYAFSQEELERPLTAFDWTPPCPILQVHGERDLQLPIEQTRSLFAKLGGADHEFLMLAGEGHETRGRENVCLWIQRGVTFLNEHLRE